MPLEREIKLRFDSADEARAKILALGAAPLLGRRLQEDCLFDTDDEKLRRQRSTLRVRSEGGKSLLTPDVARRLRAPSDTDGVLVSDVEQGSPAFRQGLARGDIILQVNRKSVKSPQEASRALSQVASGGTAFLLVMRGGQEQFFTVRKE